MPGPSRTERVTRGDAEAVLNASGGAGRIINRKGVVQFGTPADVNLKATIRPFSTPTLRFDGRHYCVEDWHVILAAEVYSGGQQAAEELASQTTLTFTLDGQVLQETTRTAVKRVLDPVAGVEDGFFFMEGQLMSPDALTVGRHSLSYTVDAPDGHFENGITFFIDPDGEGACL